MKKLLGLAAGLTLAAVAAPSLAQAQNAYTTDYVNLRAGPGLEYPVVFEVQQGQPLQSYGCLDGYSWCDVTVDGYRGWIAGEFIQYAYNGGYEPLYTYGPRYHVPIISFVFGSYWDTHYRNYRWYSYRDNWSHYDWRSRRWDNDHWRQWANNNRHDWDRWDGRRDGRDGRRDGNRDGDWRNGRNDRDGNRPLDDWRRQAHNNGAGGWNGRDNDRNNGDRNNGRNGGWNGRSDNDRRPGSPVRDPATGGVHTNDPSVHSGNTDNRNGGNRFGNPQRWGNSSYKPDSVNYGNSNRRLDNNNDGNNDRGKRFDNQSNTRIDRNVVTPKVDAPRTITPRVDRSNNTPKVDRSNRNDNGNNGGNKVDRLNKSNDNNRSNEGKNNKRDRDRDGRS